jgi:quercetin dioxygenase-like cupin family protein
MGIVHKFQGTSGPYRWDGVTVEDYGASASPGVTRQILVGEKEGSTNFIIRYFELPKGASSALHTHNYEHGVVILRGHGSVRIGDREQELSFGDVVWVAPDELHQFKNSGDETFAFTCTIKAQ